MLALKSKSKHNFTTNYTIKTQVLQCQTAHRMLLTPLEFSREFLDLSLEQWCRELHFTCVFCHKAASERNHLNWHMFIHVALLQMFFWAFQTFMSIYSTPFKFRHEKSTCILSTSVSPLHMMYKSGSYF